MSNYIVEMRDIEKRFGSIQAIKSGQFNLKRGEIHSLIGENGAGKSTMMKILYGMHDIDSGQILILDKDYPKLSTKEAIQLGIGMVHQEFMLVDDLSVLENVILGFEPRRGVWIDFTEAQKVIQKYIDEYQLSVQLNKKVKSIPIGEAQRVEIIKALFRGAEILILDEPTAVLTPQESRKLFEILRELKNDGKSIIFISHKLQEVMDISDRITVMRQGEFVGTVQKEETNTAELARMMVGRDVLLDLERVPVQVGETVLEVCDLWTSGSRELSKIRGLSFQVRSGEIVGIAGIDGNGQSELIEAITGLRKVEKGTVKVQGKEIQNLGVDRIRKSGVGHIPEDRNTRGLNRQATIEENLIVTELDKYSRAGILKNESMRKNAQDLIARFDIRPAQADLKTQNMSGGNAQKVVVAREVAAGTPLLIACQPTRGVDIGAIESIRSILNEVKKAGGAILLVSAELEEILSLSDRILVMYEGAMSGEVSYQEAHRENIGMLMMGGRKVEKHEPAI